jgi:micrococcal nuclease
MKRAFALTTAGLVILLLAPALAATSKAPLPKILAGKAVAVANGGTSTILVDRTQHRIRLDSIDCPERGQPFGTRAKQFTSGAVFGKQITVRVTDKDRYGRYVGRVAYQAEDAKGKPVTLDLSQELVRNGLAWWYRKYAPKDKQLAGLEAEVKKAKRSEDL